MERMPTDSYRKQSALIRLIRSICGLFSCASFETALGQSSADPNIGSAGDQAADQAAE
jgi:hypothetical protein